MTRFADVLKRAGDGLDVSEPSRRQILLEMASDLEASYQHFLDQGMDEREARQRAEQAFGTSDETLRLLTRVHQAPLGEFSDHLSQQIAGLWSKMLMTALFLFEILLFWKTLGNRSLFVNSSPFLAPVGCVALVGVLFTIWKLTQIYSRSGFDLKRLRTGLAIPLYLAATSLGIAGLGFLFHLHRFFRLNADGAPETLFTNFAGWMISISSLMVISLIIAILAGMVWFVLSRLVGGIERRQLDALLHPSI